jgi:hypothetical protein
LDLKVFKCVVIFTLSLWGGASSSQTTVDFNEYRPISCGDELPAQILKGPLQGYLDDIKGLPEEADKDLQEQTLKYHQRNNLALYDFFWSGKTLFGDELTNYVNKVGQKVLEQYPEVKGEITFYTYKSASINAFCTGKGAIFINVGLIAKLKNEAELAFTISHEIVHYLKKHSVNSFLERYAMFNQNKKDDKLNYDSKIDLLYQFSRNNEFQADSLGIIRYLNLGYDEASVSRLLKMLYYAYLPLENVPFDFSFFNSNHLIIPKYFYLDSVNPIAEIEERNDLFHTHPNVSKRINLAQKMVENSGKIGGSQYLLPESEFKKISSIAKFESVHLNLMGRDYTKAIYNAFVLMQDHPNSKYLRMVILKGVYGLSKYKSANEFSLVSEGYYRMEGESQRLLYLFKHLTRKQVNVLAIDYVTKFVTDYPDSELALQYRNDLIKDFVVINELKLDDFNKETVKYADDEQWKKFHLNAFVDDLKTAEFAAEFEKYQADLEEKKMLENQSYKAKEAQDKLDKKEIEQNGYGKHITSLIVLDPIYISSSNKKKLEFIFSEEKKSELDQKIIKIAEGYGIKTTMLSTGKLNGASDFKTMSQLKGWFQEWNNHSETEMISLFSEEMTENLSKYGSDYVYNLYVYTSKSSKYTIFLSYLINIRTGEEVFFRTERESGHFSETFTASYIKKDLSRIRK